MEQLLHNTESAKAFSDHRFEGGILMPTRLREVTLIPRTILRQKGLVPQAFCVVESRRVMAAITIIQAKGICSP